jgi:sugar phosphate isomerase/epimerase
VERYAVCQAVLRSGDIATDIEWAARAEAAGIGLEAQSVIAAGTGTVLAMLNEAGLGASSLMGALDPILAMAGAPEAEARSRAMIELCAELGAPGLLLTTGALGDRSIIDADRECAEWLAAMAPLAVEAGVSLLVEPVHPLLRHVSYVHTLRHATELTGERPGTGLLVDTGHLWWDRSLFDDITAHAARIGSVQIDDIDADAMAAYSYRRTQLGDGVVPLPEIVDALETAGYRGLYENENIARTPTADRIEFARLGGERLAAMIADAHS